MKGVISLFLKKNISRLKIDRFIPTHMNSRAGRRIRSSCISEAFENIKPGRMAKEVYRIFSDTEFSETFSLAARGKKFEAYSDVVLKRKTDNSANEKNYTSYSAIVSGLSILPDKNEWGIFGQIWKSGFKRQICRPGRSNIR
jgi:hypothetical protein